MNNVFSIGPAFQFLFLALYLVPTIFFLLTLQSTLKVIRVENRRMDPGGVWLLLIPVFNLVWQFVVTRRMAVSIGNQCVASGIDLSDSRPTYKHGLAWNICSLLVWFPIFGAIAALVTWILYWAKVHEYKKLIENSGDNFMLDAERNVFHHDNSSAR